MSMKFVSNLDRTTECTQLQSLRDIQSTSKQASGSQGPLKMAYWTLAQNFWHFSQKNQNTSCYDQLEEAGSRSFFSNKNLWEKQISVWYGMVWSTNNSECMEAHVPAVNTVLAMWYKYKYYKIQHFSNILTKNTLWRCSRHAHQAKLELLTWAVASFQKLISYSGSLKPAVSRCVGKWNEVTLIYSGRVAWSLPKSLRFYLEVKMKWPNQTL